MSMKKIVFAVLILIGLYLILVNGNAFNTAFKTGTDSLIKGVAVLQGRDGSVVS